MGPLLPTGDGDGGGGGGVVAGDLSDVLEPVGPATVATFPATLPPAEPLPTCAGGLVPAVAFAPAAADAGMLAPAAPFPPDCPLEAEELPGIVKFAQVSRVRLAKCMTRLRLLTKAGVLG